MVLALAALNMVGVGLEQVVELSAQTVMELVVIK